jgi:hypothetical protein
VFGGDLCKIPRRVFYAPVGCGLLEESVAVRNSGCHGSFGASGCFIHDSTEGYASFINI